jgi:hypothetical protein
MQDPTFSATLADQHREQLRGQADQIRLSRQGHPRSRPRQPRCPPVAANHPASPDLTAGQPSYPLHGGSTRSSGGRPLC